MLVKNGENAKSPRKHSDSNGVYTAFLKLKMAIKQSACAWYLFYFANLYGKVEEHSLFLNISV